jgi:hypothetical protein
VFVSFGQSFDKGYNLTGIPKGLSSPYDPSINVSIDPKDASLSKEDIDNFKKQLAKHIRETENNLQDDSTHLKDDFNALWTGFHTTYLNEIRALYSYLDKGIKPASPLIWVPDPTYIETFLQFFTKAHVEPAEAARFEQKEFRLYTKDVFRAFLYTWVQDKLYKTSFPFQQIDITYKTGWRQLEKWDDELTSMINRSRDLLNSKYTISDYQDLYSAVKNYQIPDYSKNSIYDYFQKDKAIRSMSWFTGGTLHMNPLLVTDDERRYPLTEKNSFLDPGFVRRVDSLKKADWLKQLFTTDLLANKVTLPIRHKNSATKDNLVILQYNAGSKDYDAPNKLEKFIYGKDTLTVVVHNLSKDKTVDIKTPQTEKPNQSRQELALNEFLVPISSLVKVFSPLASTAAKVLAPIQPGSDKALRGIAIPSAQLARSATSGAGDLRMKFIHTEPFSLNRKVEDAKKIIIQKAFFVKGLRANSEMNELINAFVQQDPIKLEDNDVKRFAEETLENFKIYLENKLMVLIDGLSKPHSKIRALVRISNRSLPPAAISEHKSTAPELRTEVQTEKLTKPVQEVNVNIFEGNKEGKEQREIVRQQFILAKRTKWDVSGGVAYTYFESFYTITEKGNGVPVVEPANHFQFIGALHWYPKGMTKIDDGLWPLKGERLSIFAGLSFTKPLDNYYGGVSYDIVPGIKIMTGLHLYRNTHYKIINDQVDEKAKGLKFMGPFVSLNIGPATLATLLGLF